MNIGKPSPAQARQRASRHGGRGRAAIFALLMVLMTYGLVEGIAAGFYWLRFGAPFSFSAVAERQRQVELTEVGDPSASSQRIKAPLSDKGIFGARVIHPYTGFASEPFRLKNDQGCNINKYGFYGTEGFLDRPPGSVNVVVSGGSFANHCLCSSPTELIHQLGTVPRFKDKKIRLIGLTAGGFKQPQQAMALNYFLSLGGHADLAILVDGFNEVLSRIAAGPGQPHPAYPEKWHMQVSFLNDRELARSLGAARVINDLRREVLRLLESLDFSVLADTLWRLADTRLEQEVNRQRAAAERAAARMAGKGAPPTFASHGPRLQITDPAAYSASLWASSLQQMALSANSNRFPLYAFLQPNQYLKGSKPLSAEEQRDFTVMRFVFSEPLNAGYERLRRLGAGLKVPGFTFTDLSNVYHDVGETLYVDSCCHVNRRGCDLLFQRVGEVLRKGNLGPLPAQ